MEEKPSFCREHPNLDQIWSVLLTDCNRWKQFSPKWGQLLQKKGQNPKPEPKPQVCLLICLWLPIQPCTIPSTSQGLLSPPLPRGQHYNGFLALWYLKHAQRFLRNRYCYIFIARFSPQGPRGVFISLHSLGQEGAKNNQSKFGGAGAGHGWSLWIPPSSGYSVIFWLIMDVELPLPFPPKHPLPVSFSLAEVGVTSRSRDSVRYDSACLHTSWNPIQNGIN